MEVPMTKRTQFDLTRIKDFRKNYEEQYGKIQPIVYFNYFKVIMLAIREFVIQGGHLTLPYNLGAIYIRRKVRRGLFFNGKLKDRYVDWKATYEHRAKKYPDYTREDWLKPENKEKGIICFNNEHSDGMVYKIIHSRFKQSGRLENFNGKYYYFKPIVRFSRQLAKFLKTINKIPTYYEYNKTHNSTADNRVNTG